MATSCPALRLAAVTLVLLSGASIAAAPATHADSSPRTKAAQAELSALNIAVDSAVEDYDQGRLSLVKVQRSAQRARSRVEAAQALLQAAQAAIGTVAASAYRTGGADQMIQLMTVSEPGAFLRGAGALEQVARTRDERLRDVRVVRHQLESIQADAQREYTAERVATERLAKTRDLITASVARQEALVATLVSSDERAAAQRAADAQRAAAERLFASNKAAALRSARQNRSVRASRGDQRDAAASGDNSGNAGGSGDGPVTGRGSQAVQFAYAQIGKPYSWGQDGPGSFDCSGLTSAAWSSAGVSLSHSSRAQIGEGRRVSRSELQPGDLVFFGSPIHHVGIYVGGGQMINAPQSGDLVGVRSMSRGDYAGAVRPG